MRRRDDAIAAGWGFGEAVLWFVIPDVFLTLVAVRRGVRAALRTAVLAVAGAVLGGLVVYGWGSSSPASGEAAMVALPGVDRPMVERVRYEVTTSGAAALLAGPRRMQPYKLYALAAGEQGTGAWSLAMWTVPGRAVRFVVASLVASGMGVACRRLLPNGVTIGLWAAFWVSVYVQVWT